MLLPRKVLFDIDRHFPEKVVGSFRDKYPHVFLSQDAVQNIQQTTSAFYRCKQCLSPYDEKGNPDYQLIRDNESRLTARAQVLVLRERTQQALKNVKRRAFVKKLGDAEFWCSLEGAALDSVEHQQVIAAVKEKIGVAPYVGFRSDQLLYAKPIRAFIYLFDLVGDYTQSLAETLDGEGLPRKDKRFLLRYLQYLVGWQQVILSEYLQLVTVLSHRVTQQQDGVQLDDLVYWGYHQLQSIGLLSDDVEKMETRNSPVNAALRMKILKEIEVYNEKKQRLYDFISTSRVLTNHWLDTHFRKSTYKGNRWLDSYYETVDRYRGSLWLWFLNQKQFSAYFSNNTRFLSIELHLDQLSSLKGEHALKTVLSGEYRQLFEKLQQAIQHEMTSIVHWITFNWFFKVLYQVQVAVAFAVKVNLEKSQFAAFKNRVAIMASLELATRVKFAAYMNHKAYFTQAEREKLNKFLSESTSALAVLAEKGNHFSALYRRARQLSHRIMCYHMTVKNYAIAQENILRIQTSKTHGTTNTVMKGMFQEKAYTALVMVVGYLSKQADQAMNEARTHPIKRYRTALQVFSSCIITAFEQHQVALLDNFFCEGRPLLEDMAVQYGQCESNLRLMYRDISDIYRCFMRLQCGVCVSDKMLREAHDKYQYLNKQHAVGKALVRQLDKTLLYAEERVEEGVQDKSTVSCAAYLMMFGIKAQRTAAVNYISDSFCAPERFEEEEKKPKEKRTVCFSDMIKTIPRGKR